MRISRIGAVAAATVGLAVGVGSGVWGGAQKEGPKPHVSSEAVQRFASLNEMQKKTIQKGLAEYRRLITRLQGEEREFYNDQLEKMERFSERDWENPTNRRQLYERLESVRRAARASQTLKEVEATRRALERLLRSELGK